MFLGLFWGDLIKCYDDELCNPEEDGEPGSSGRTKDEWHFRAVPAFMVKWLWVKAGEGCETRDELGIIFWISWIITDMFWKTHISFAKGRAESKAYLSMISMMLLRPSCVNAAEDTRCHVSWSVVSEAHGRMVFIGCMTTSDFIKWNIMQKSYNAISIYKHEMFQMRFLLHIIYIDYSIYTDIYIIYIYME